MATFQPAGVYTQSLDGKTMTFSDTSLNPNNLVFTKRELVVTDGNGNSIIDTLIPTGATQVSFPIAKDAYLATALKWTDGDGNIYTGEVNYLAKQFYNLASLTEANDISCGCDCFNESNAIKAMACSLTASTAFMMGFAAPAQKRIESANKFISY